MMKNRLEEAVAAVGNGSRCPELSWKQWDVAGTWEGAFLSGVPSRAPFIRALPRANIWGGRTKGCGQEEVLSSGAVCTVGFGAFLLNKEHQDSPAPSPGTVWGWHQVMTLARSPSRSEFYLVVCLTCHSSQKQSKLPNVSLRKWLLVSKDYFPHLGKKICNWDTTEVKLFFYGWVGVYIYLWTTFVRPLEDR